MAASRSGRWHRNGAVHDVDFIALDAGGIEFAFDFARLNRAVHFRNRKKRLPFGCARGSFGFQSALVSRSLHGGQHAVGGIAARQNAAIHDVDFIIGNAGFLEFALDFTGFNRTVHFRDCNADAIVGCREHTMEPS